MYCPRWFSGHRLFLCPVTQSCDMWCCPIGRKPSKAENVSAVLPAGSQYRAQSTGLHRDAGFSAVNWGSGGWSWELSWRKGMLEELTFYGVLRAGPGSGHAITCTPCEQKGTLLRNSALSDVPQRWVITLARDQALDFACHQRVHGHRRSL